MLPAIVRNMPKMDCCDKAKLLSESKVTAYPSRPHPQDGDYRLLPSMEVINTIFNLALTLIPFVEETNYIVLDAALN